MASRALGAFFALAAAAAIVVSIASSAWWAGTPVVEGRAMEAKYVHAGPLGATGCNVGGDNSCEPLTIDQTVQLVGYGELALAALATLFLFVVLSAALRVSDHRRGLALASLLFTLLAAGGGGALLALGPGIEASQHVDVPIGWGAFTFGGGVLASIIASLITRKLEPEPLRLKPSMQNIPQPVDVRKALREQHDGLRPAALGPEPQLGTHHAHETPQRASNPLIEGAPQLRPLYDPQGAGVVPSPHAPNLPTSAPTPLPREAIGQLMGRTPPPQSHDASRPRMAPSTPALNRGAQQSSSPRIRPPAVEEPIESYEPVGSYERADSYDGPVNPFAHTKPPSEPPPSPRMRPPSTPPARPPQPKMPPLRDDDEAFEAARGKPPTNPPPRPSAPGMPASWQSPSSALPGMSMRDDDEAFETARGKPPTNPPPRPSASNALPGMSPARGKPPTSPPSRPSASSELPGMSPARGKPPTSPPPRPSPAPGMPSGGKPTDAPSRPSPALPGMSAMHGTSPTDAPPRPSNTALPGMSAAHATSPTDASQSTNAAPGMSSTDAPPTMSPMHGTPPSDAPSRPSDHALPGVSPTRGKPSTDAPSRPSNSALPGMSPMRGKPPTDAPARPSPSSIVPPGLSRGTPPGDAARGIPPTNPPRGKPATLAPVRSVIPSPAPGLRGKSIVVPEHLRAGTEPGTPPPGEVPGGRGSRSGITPPPSLHNKTLAHAVPPMPSTEDAGSPRAQTENDDRLETAMRATEHITAVDIDDEAKAADARPRRSDTEMGTGPNAFRVEEVTAVGLEAAAPAPAFHPGDDAEWNRAGSQAEHTSQTRLPEARREPEDLMKTIEHNPKTPIPSLDRGAPTPEQEAERRSHVPITTAPTTLPPPKQVDVVPSGPTPACPQCEAPMNWVEEHLRFYCKQCRMYF